MHFNPRSHEGSDRGEKSIKRKFSISIHAPTRGATVRVTAVQIHPPCISIHAPTRGATLYHAHCQISDIYISIHAPTRGATSLQIEDNYIHMISIHAPTRGATGQIRCLRCGILHFNPRSHEGSDHIRRVQVFRPSNFNPRSHEGSDL